MAVHSYHKVNILYILYISFLSLISALSSILNRNGVNVLVFLGVTLSTVIFGFRYGVGVDYFNYEYYYYYRAESFGSDLGYSVINWFFHILGLEFYWVTVFVFFFIALFFVYGCLKFGLHGRALLLAFLIFSSNSMLLYLNGMRQGMAASALLVATYFLINKNLLRSFLLFSIALTLHLSAIFFVILPLALRFLRMKSLLVFQAIFIPIVFVGVFYFSLSDHFNNLISIVGVYDNYVLESKIAAGGLPYGVLLRSVFCVMAVFYFLKLNDDRFFWGVPVFNLYCFGVILNVLSVQDFLFGRVGYLFYLFEPIALSLVYALSKSVRMRTIIYLVLVFYAMIIMFAALVLGAESNKLVYQSVFFR